LVASPPSHSPLCASSLGPPRKSEHISRWPLVYWWLLKFSIPIVEAVASTRTLNLHPPIPLPLVPFLPRVLTLRLIKRLGKGLEQPCTCRVHLDHRRKVTAIRNTQDTIRDAQTSIHSNTRSTWDVNRDRHDHTWESQCEDKSRNQEQRQRPISSSSSRSTTRLFLAQGFGSGHILPYTASHACTHNTEHGTRNTTSRLGGTRTYFVAQPPIVDVSRRATSAATSGYCSVSR
jgi:hypothetical protein